MNREYTTHDVMEIIKKEDDNKPALVIPSCELAVDAFVSEQCLNLLVKNPKQDPDYYDGPITSENGLCEAQMGIKQEPC